MYFSDDRHPLLALFVMIAYFYVDQKLFTDIYDREVRAVEPYLMGMSVFMGYYAFDLQGIFYGPLLICLVRIVYDIFTY